MPRLKFAKFSVWVIPFLLLVGCTDRAPTPAPVTDQETQLGLAIYNELRDQGEIIESSPLYDSLSPVGQAISRAAASQYPHPINFILVHESQPNAFSVPGGNIYVTDALLFFVRNKEELAGTLCHETAHTIHRDALHRMQEEQRIARREIGAAILLDPSLAGMLAINAIGDLHSAAYSRDVESSADVTGSDICAAAGYNPWGLVWLFQDFQNGDPSQIPELLSDHPANGTRMRTLEVHFHDNASVFSRFNPNPSSASPISIAKNSPEQFLPANPNEAAS